MALADTRFIFKKTKQNKTTTRLYYLLAWAASVKKKQHPFTTFLEMLLSLGDFTATVVTLWPKHSEDGVTQCHGGGGVRSVSGPVWARTMAPFQHV